MADIPMSAEERKFKEVADEMMRIHERNNEYIKAIDGKDYLKISILFCEAQKDIMGYLMDKLPEGEQGDNIRGMILDGMLDVGQQIDAHKELHAALEKVGKLNRDSRFSQGH